MTEKKKRGLVDAGLIAVGIGLTAGLLWLLYRLLVVVALAPLVSLFMAMGDGSEELLLTSVSPGGIHALEIYRVDQGALEPYYVKVNRVDGEERRMIYYVRGQDDAEILWMSDTIAEINGVPVDVTGDECFTANARGYFDVTVQVKAKDVQWLEINVSMGGEPRVTHSRTGVTLEDAVDVWGISSRLNVLKELHWDDDLSQKKAGLTVTLRTVDGKEITLPYIREWTAVEYGNYAFTLTGSARGGYTLTQEENK